MSAHTKKRPTSGATDTITVLGKRYVAPKKTLKAILTLIESQPDVQEDRVPYDEIVQEKIKAIGKGAMALKGARARAGMTQKMLAKKLKVDQALISKMENGRVDMSKELAGKLAKLFNVDHRVFLR